MADLLGNGHFAPGDLPKGEPLRKACGALHAGVVLWGQDGLHARPGDQSVRTLPPAKGFRIPVPESLPFKARRAFLRIQKEEE